MPDLETIRVVIPDSKIVKINVFLPGQTGSAVFGPQSPHLIFAGPGSGFFPGIPSFRLAVPDDIAFAAILAKPNVFTRETTLHGLRVVANIITSDYTALPTDFDIQANATGGSITVMLPQALGTGQIMRVKKIDSSTNAVVVDAQGGDVFDGGATTINLPSQDDGCLVVDVANGIWDVVILPESTPSGVALLAAPNVFTDHNEFTGFGVATKTIAADYSLTNLDFELLVDTTAGDVQVFLPMAVSSGQTYHIKKIDTSSHIVRVIANGGDLIDGSISVNLVDQWADCYLIDGQTGYWDNVFAITGGGGGSSLLSNKILRVDASGNDSTGTIGDLGSPFLTVAAAIAAIEAADPGNGFGYVIDIGNNNFTETLTTSLRFLTFVGTGGFSSNANAFSDLTYSATNQVNLSLNNCNCGTIEVTDTGGQYLQILLFDGTTGNITVGNGGIFVFGTNVDYDQVGSVTVAGPSELFQCTLLGNFTNTTGKSEFYLANLGAVSITCGSNDINISTCPNTLNDSTFLYVAPTIVSAGTVWVLQSVLQDVTCTTLNLIDARVAGTNSAGTTNFHDVLLSGGGGATIPATTNLIAGDGAGNGADSGIAPANVVVKSSATRPTTLNEVINLLVAAGLCS